MDDDGETTYETPMFPCFQHKIHRICVYWSKKQRIHIALIVVDLYLQHQGEVDSSIPHFSNPVKNKPTLSCHLQGLYHLSDLHHVSEYNHSDIFLVSLAQ